MFSAPIADLITGLFSFVFTIMIFSYVIGDNPFFRVAIHVFVGLAAGFVTLVVFEQIFINKLIAPMLTGNWTQLAFLAIPLIMGFLLLSKVRYQKPGRWVVAFLVGVGAAAAIAGALGGTLLPQVWASINLFDFSENQSANFVDKLVEGIIILTGTVFTLAYFQFGVRENATKPGKSSVLMRAITSIAEFFIAITFGALFAGVLSAALTALVERTHSIINFFNSLFFQ